MKFTSLLTALTTNPWFTLILSILTLLGFILSIYFYRKSKIRKQLNISISTITIVNSERPGFEDIVISFAGEKATIVSVTKLIIKNAGNACIKYVDIPPLGPICIEIDEKYKILKIKIKEKKTNNFRRGKFIKENNELETIEFDYINPNEYCEVSIFHTSTNGSNVKIGGALEGGRITYSYDTLEISSTVLAVLPALFSVRTTTITLVELMYKLIKKRRGK